MNFELVKIDRLSGNKASIYSILLGGEDITLLDRFWEENKFSSLSELKDIIARLNTIGHNKGAREDFFKKHEGKPGDGVCALYDDDENKLRLYCIRYGTLIVILGGGGPKNVRALQDDPKLTEENKIMVQVSSAITKRIKEQRIKYSKDWMDFEGDLMFNDEDE